MSMEFVDCIYSQRGLYTFREVSLFAQIPIATLRYWFLGDKRHKPVREAVMSSGGMYYLTFQDFVEAVAIRHLRTKHRLTLPKIREAVLEARQVYKVEYPFTDVSKRIISDSKDLHLKTTSNSDPVQLSGKRKKQTSFRQIVTAFMVNLELDDDGQFEFIAAKYGALKIALNPRFMFGSPRVQKAPFAAVTLWRARNVEGSVELVSKLFNVSRDIVEASCSYCEEELKLAA